jgi:long-chain acyl-CoA synthetase
MSLEAAHAWMTRPGSPFEMEERLIRGVRLRTWKHGPQTLRDVFVAGRAHGDKTYLVYDDLRHGLEERASFEAFGRATLALAEALGQGGVAKGDRVVLAMRNLPEWPVAYFATLLRGAIAVPLNAWWTGPELEYALRDSGAQVAIVDDERLARIADALPRCPALRRVIASRTAGAPLPAPVERLENLIGTVADWPALPPGTLPAVDLDPEDDATIFYTSGTTGHPKGALGTHRNSVTVIVASGFSPQRAYVRRGEPIPDPAARTTQRASIVGVPFFHVTGCHALICPALYNGSKVVAMHRWDTERALQLIERERCTQAGGVPTLAWQILEHPARERYDLSSLEVMSYGGAPAASELVRRLKAVFPFASPGTGWGMTETSATFTHHSAEDYEAHPDSAGLALPVCDMKVVAADDPGTGRELPRGEVGELWARGPNVVRGYWGKPEATAETFVDGWLRTGDLARIDAEGFLTIVDRKKDMLIRGGENIYCVEVEDALFAHPAVMDAGVIGLPHRTLGEEPAAVVTLKPGHEASEDELRAFVRGRLAAFKVPVRILTLRETLPRNANGKIMKPALRPLFGDAA